MSALPVVPMLGAPTASGKSALALKLAERLPLELISADAMQVYRGMDIGTAKPSAEERVGLPHHLVDVVTPAEPFSVADWVRLAEDRVSEISARGNIPFIVGGTGFYLQALAEGLPTVPAVDNEVQERLWRELELDGIDRLVQELAEASPEDAERVQRNPRRVVRAVEILRRSGRPPLSFPRTSPRYRYSLTVLQPPLAALRSRIEERCRQMFADGLVQETEALLARYPQWLTATQAIGYKEVAEALAGGSSLERAQDEVLRATIRYARRQLTWFRKQDAYIRLPLLADDAAPQVLAWLEGLAARI